MTNKPKYADLLKNKKWACKKLIGRRGGGIGGSKNRILENYLNDFAQILEIS